ncbi:MAG: hypothetical protein QOG54_1823 [Actinomycetota bacterium]|jgi:hypothetical protein|nr:hypothetical protein [Actinomycetota bacterium]
MSSVGERLSEWWTMPIARGRLAALRTILYLFVFVDVLVTTSWVARHALVPGDLYQPLFLARFLGLPEPEGMAVTAIEILLLVTAAVAASGRSPRVAGAAVFVLYLVWMFIGMSYGKVDHDRFAFLVALAVLPTAPKARWGDQTPDEAAGWAIRCIQVSVVATYFLAAFAKLRFGGPGWVNGATLMRAILRRGTSLVEWLKSSPWVLRISQYGIVAFELLSPLMLRRDRIGKAFVLAAFMFHIVTYASITIVFLPHVMCLLAFLPLERIPSPLEALRRRSSGSAVLTES